MTIFVFLGPTLAVEEARAELDAVYLPPASQGDVYSAARRRPWGIGIVDGYFERVPSVWHKEILWAMSRGVHVFGSASMGALRAAELAAFGMEGVGAVFAAYASGELEDDDEVAIVHGRAESGFRPLSEAMVNLRASLQAAVAQRVIGEAAHARLLALAKGLGYRDRSWPRVLAAAAADGVPAAERAALAAWLPAGRVDQKRLDALAMLGAMRRRREAEPGPKRTLYPFHNTDMWHALRSEIDRRPLDDSPGADTLPPDGALDELRLDEELYDRTRQASLLRLLGLYLAEQVDLRAAEDRAREEAASHRRRHQLEPEDRFRAWLERQGLTGEGFDGLMRDEAALARVIELAGPRLDGYLCDQLRVDGRYADLEERSRHKHATLSAHGLDQPQLRDAGLTREELWRWYFEDRLGRPVPPDPEDLARQVGFSDVGSWERALLREYCYGRLLAPREAGRGRAAAGRANPRPAPEAVGTPPPAADGNWSE